MSYTSLQAISYIHKTVNHTQGQYARDEDGKCEVHVNTMKSFCGAARAVIVKAMATSPSWNFARKIPLLFGIV